MLPVQTISKKIGIDNTIVYAWFSSMNTRVDIMLCNGKERKSKSIIEHIYKQLDNLEKTGNYFNPSSELSTLNNGGYKTSLSVSHNLFSMIKMCIYYNKLTNGYFDVSIHSDDYTATELESISISEKDSSIMFNRKGTRLDLSGFIKGYALDKVRELLKENEIDDALINIGNSSVLALGDHPFGEGWKVGIDFPDVNNHREEITLKDKFLTTSGNHSVKRKHIRSPHTREYIEGLKGISVITDSGAEGEALSTALFAADQEERNNILQHFDAIAYNL